MQVKAKNSRNRQAKSRPFPHPRRTQGPNRLRKPVFTGFSGCLCIMLHPLFPTFLRLSTRLHPSLAQHLQDDGLLSTDRGQTS